MVLAKIIAAARPLGSRGFAAAAGKEKIAMVGYSRPVPNPACRISRL